MRRMLTAAALAAAGWLVPATADAAIPQVFTKTASPISCTVQANGQRFCGTGTAQIGSWDGIPLDVSVAFPPAPASGADGPYPVVGIFHGWGGTKLGLTGTDVQRALSRGYAVFTMTDRGWGGSCGRLLITDPRCNGKGYIRLMHTAYEVRDAQYALGQLADDGLIEPQKIAATGGSYGGGISLALGALRTRTQLQDGSLVAVDEPARQADGDRRDPPRVHVVGPRHGAEPERLLARLRRRRAVLRRRPPAPASRSSRGTPRSSRWAPRSAITPRLGLISPQT